MANRTISGKYPPSKAKKRVAVTPPMPKSVGETMYQGGRKTHGDPPATLGAAMRNGGARQAHGNVSPGNVPSMKRSLHQ